MGKSSLRMKIYLFGNFVFADRNDRYMPVIFYTLVLLFYCFTIAYNNSAYIRICLIMPVSNIEERRNRPTEKPALFYCVLTEETTV